jgi:hypothetical protein
MLRDAGLADLKIDIIAGADTTGRSLPMLKASFSRYARDSGRVTEEEITAWLASVEHAIAQGSFLFALPQFVVRGAKQ